MVLIEQRDWKLQLKFPGYDCIAVEMKFWGFLGPRTKTKQGTCTIKESLILQETYWILKLLKKQYLSQEKTSFKWIGLKF